VGRRYLGSVITSVLGAPGSGKSTVAPVLAGKLPGHAILDWDAFTGPAAALAGQEIPGNPGTWPAYRELVHAVVGSIAHLPGVLLGVCTPDELKDWPIDAWGEAIRRPGQDCRWPDCPARGGQQLAEICVGGDDHQPVRSRIIQDGLVSSSDQANVGDVDGLESRTAQQGRDSGREVGVNQEPHDGYAGWASGNSRSCTAAAANSKAARMSSRSRYG
jgi:hypothetical protein